MIQNLVSVIIPTYNRAHLIKRSVNSVLNQSYQYIEIIIVDDGSTDNTEDIVKSINDNRVKYIKQRNQGACVARNNGIGHATGEYIAFQDSDDVWHSDKLEKQLKTLKDKNADLVVCGCIGCGRIRKKKVYLKYSDSFLDSDKWPFAIGTQTFLGKSIVFQDNKFDNSIIRWQDFEILTRIQKKYRIYCSKDLLVDYYMQNDSISKKQYYGILQTLDTVYNHNSNSINLRRKYNNDFAVNIISNLDYCPDKDIKKKLVKIAFKICDSSFYVLINYLYYKVFFFTKRVISVILRIKFFLTYSI